jgi:hypothetical protein
MPLLYDGLKKAVWGVEGSAIHVQGHQAPEL